MHWEQFAEACPEIAGPAMERLNEHELCMLGSLRRDGYPRISPCELDFTAGRLFLGMMWQSRKALDLLRNPRCVIHNCVTDRMGSEGDIKLYGVALDVQDPELRLDYRAAIKARIDWAPEEPEYHLFAIDVTSAAFAVVGEEGYILTWNGDRGLRRLPFGAA